MNRARRNQMYRIEVQRAIEFDQRRAARRRNRNGKAKFRKHTAPLQFRRVRHEPVFETSVAPPQVLRQRLHERVASMFGSVAATLTGRRNMTPRRAMA